jgi:translocation and assembly module TamA
MNARSQKPSINKMKSPQAFISATITTLILLAFQANTYSATNLKVHIKGLDNSLVENVKLSLSINQKNNEIKDDALSQQDIRRLHHQATKEIANALQPFGFYSPKTIPSLTETEGIWQASYDIRPGRPVMVRDVTITLSGEGKSEPSIKKLLEEKPINKGDVLNHQIYSNFKQLLFDELFNLGYLDANYSKSELRVDPDNFQAEIVLLLETGAKYYFGDIKIKQNIIKPEKIQQLVTVNKNTPFNTDRLIDLQLRLTDTGYFDQIEISVEKEKAVDNRIPVVINTTPSKRMKYSASVGYGTDTGPRIGLSVLNRRVNRRGHRFQYNVRFSEIESSINANYAIPIGDIYTEHWDFSINGQKENINDNESIQYSVGSSLNQNRWGGRRRLSLTLLQEEFSFDDEPNEITVLLVPGINYSRTVTDNSLFTRKGYSLNLDVKAGIKSALSDTTFLRGHANARSVIALGERSRLINRLEFGAISTDNFSLMPPSLRFFTGGSQSVRGYGYKDIGPRNNSDNNIGGEYLIAGSVELDYLLSGNYGVAIFYDVGDASDNEDFSLKESAGIGFRYKSPIGMIRIDLAHPFDDSQDDVKLHIRIGPDL